MRIKTAHIALLLSILALAVSLFTAVQVTSNDDEALINALMAQNQQLQAQIDALAERTNNEQESAGTEGITLTAVAWEDGRGADVTLTLEGAADTEAALLVMAGDTVITEVPCQWDGSVGTATAQVPAGNGYTYSMIAGSEAKTLASPENPVYPELVNLADALTAYCNLVVGEWNVRDNVLTLESGYASLHTAQLTAGGEAYTNVRLVLKHGDRILAETPISPAEVQEEPGTFACDITDAAFVMPKLPEGEQVDLWMEATLSDGQVLTTCAATWYAMASGFSMAAG